MDRQISEYSDYISRIWHQMHLNLDEMLLPYDITHQQARIVRYIYQRETAGNVSYQKDLECLMGLRGSSITSLLQGLEKKDFIKRQTIEGDARKKKIVLSEKGKTLIGEFSRIFKTAETKLLEVMNDDERKLFMMVLKRMANNLENKEKEKVKR